MDLSSSFRFPSSASATSSSEAGSVASSHGHHRHVFNFGDLMPFPGIGGGFMTPQRRDSESSILTLEQRRQELIDVLDEVLEILDEDVMSSMNAATTATSVFMGGLLPRGGGPFPRHPPSSPSSNMEKRQ